MRWIRTHFHHQSQLDYVEGGESYAQHDDQEGEKVGPLQASKHLEKLDNLSFRVSHVLGDPVPVSQVSCG